MDKKEEKRKNSNLMLSAVYSLCKQSIITTSPETLIINLNAGDSAWMRTEWRASEEKKRSIEIATDPRHTDRIVSKRERQGRE